MQDSLLYDLALDWRRPYCKVKFQSEDDYVWGQFSHIDVSSWHPIKIQFDAYKKGSWEKYLMGVNSECYFIDADSYQIEDIEIVGFKRLLKDKPVKFSKIKKNTKTLYIPSCVQDSLGEWDLKKCGLLRDSNVTRNTIIRGRLLPNFVLNRYSK